MKPKRPFKKPFRRQPTSLEMRDELLRFIQSKFYPGDFVRFAKDRRMLLKLVVLKFAVYLDEKAVTLAEARYMEIVRDKILMEAVRFGKIEQVKYPPAYLGQILDSHLRIHGEDYYEEAKAIRHLVNNALSLVPRTVTPAPDGVRELAAASRLLTPQKRAVKPVVSAQAELF